MGKEKSEGGKVKRENKKEENVSEKGKEWQREFGT
jgi:hypothetical protein